MLLPGPRARAWTWDVVSLQGKRPRCLPSCEVHDASTLLAGTGGPRCPWSVPPQRGCDTVVSSTSCQEKQQNVVAEVSAQPFPDLPITLISSKYFCFPPELQGEPPCPSPCVWGGGQAVLTHGVPRGELVARRCGAHVLTAAVLEPPAVAALQRR